MNVYCECCNRKTNHEEIKSHKKASTHEDDFQWEEYFYIAKCKGCETITFIRKYSDEEMWREFNSEVSELQYKYTIFDIPTINTEKRLVKEDFRFVPDFIEDLYTEVIDAYNRSMLVLCAVGQRMLIEAICKEKAIDTELLTENDGSPKLDHAGNQKIKYLNLKEKINKLCSEGYITRIQTEVLHQIRDMGNATAHEITKHNNMIIEDALKVLEHMLYSIYELESKKIYTK